jgi:hypothetical protein
LAHLATCGVIFSTHYDEMKPAHSQGIPLS